MAFVMTLQCEEDVLRLPYRIEENDRAGTGMLCCHRVGINLFGRPAPCSLLSSLEGRGTDLPSATFTEQLLTGWPAMRWLYQKS